MFDNWSSFLPFLQVAFFYTGMLGFFCIFFEFKRAQLAPNN